MNPTPSHGAISLKSRLIKQQELLPPNCANNLPQTYTPPHHVGRASSRSAGRARKQLITNIHAPCGRRVLQKLQTADYKLIIWIHRRSTVKWDLPAALSYFFPLPLFFALFSRLILPAAFEIASTLVLCCFAIAS